MYLNFIVIAFITCANIVLIQKTEERKNVVMGLLDRERKSGE